MNSCIEALKHYFGFETFLDHQQQVVEAMVAGEELCVVMPTGAGKSLCYQLPILMRDGYGIIISPLIALMKDQVETLRNRQIPAAFINSTISSSEQRATAYAAANGEVKLLYIAPERLHTDFFRDFIYRYPPSTLVVDEAHCISEWGHDFRPMYRRIGEVVEALQLPQVCAFTATATPFVCRDVIKQLRRTEMKLLVAGFRRPNLAFKVMECSGKDDKLKKLQTMLEANRVPTLIYAATRQAVDELAKVPGITGYHAGMKPEVRNQAQDYFMNDPAPVLAATNAFGMGIDRSDVRRVIHYQLPGSLEAYYQEAGRAGRDGEAAECILLFSYADRYIQKFLIEMNNPTAAIIRWIYSVLRRHWIQSKGEPIESTLSELAKSIPEVKSEGEISAALGVLERSGFVERSARSHGSGMLEFIGNLSELSLIHQLENTQRSRFIHRLIKHYGTNLSKTGEYLLDDLAAVAGLSLEQLRRVISSLNGEIIKWTPAFSGRAIILTQPEIEEPNLNDAELDAKLEHEINRLDEVVSYARTRDCRQAALVKYFGENTANWSCGCCDRCIVTPRGNLRAVTIKEQEIIDVILRAADNFGGRIGIAKLSQILAGVNTAAMAAGRWNNSRWFGALAKYKQSQIENILRELENDQCLERIMRSSYPCIGISARGLEVLSGHATAQITTSISTDKTAKISKKSPKISSKNASSLLIALRNERNRLATERRVPAYRILSNQVLEELAKIRPGTPLEAQEISGIGPVKAASVIPFFLDIIEKYEN